MGKSSHDIWSVTIPRGGILQVRIMTISPSCVITTYCPSNQSINTIACKIITSVLCVTHQPPTMYMHTDAAWPSRTWRHVRDPTMLLGNGQMHVLHVYYHRCFFGYFDWKKSAMKHSVASEMLNQLVLAGAWLRGGRNSEKYQAPQNKLMNGKFGNYHLKTFRGCG